MRMHRPGEPVGIKGHSEKVSKMAQSKRIADLVEEPLIHLRWESLSVAVDRAVLGDVLDQILVFGLTVGLTGVRWRESGGRRRG